jgi:histidyl-tRNA synthetase
MARKPSIPKGTRDFTPGEVSRRNYIISAVKKHFETFGFQPIETPSFENLDTLLGKYGEEGDRLIFKILNSGDFMNKVDPKIRSQCDSQALMPEITDKALRYDLTVPFARYVVMHQNELDFPFKRYQIQPVWRADKPQKGRFREFYQCDADVVGPQSLLQEAEFIQLYDAVFKDLGLNDVVLKLNHRKILSGIAEVIGAGDKLVDFTVALDKLDKVGEEGVVREMKQKGIAEVAIEKALPLFHLYGTNEERLDQLDILLQDSETGRNGVAELRKLLGITAELGVMAIAIQLDVTLARGLDYYTGTIYEAAAPKGVNMGSVGGGGRYDDLTGIFGMNDMSGVGISFGLDRIYLVMQELNLFPEEIGRSLEVLCVNFGENEAMAAFGLVQFLRKAGIKADLYPTLAKIQKQFKYADKRGVPYVILIGEEELAARSFVVKEMSSGRQNSYSLDTPEEFLKTL